MKKNLLLLGMASVFALTGCHGTKKVEFKEFGEEVANISGDFKAEKVKVSGKVEGESFKAYTVSMSDKNPELDDKQTKAYAVCLPSVTVAELSALLAIQGSLTGLDDYSFYVGNGFKVTYENKDSKAKAKYEYDKNGMLVSLYQVKDSKTTRISLKWTYEKK